MNGKMRLLVVEDEGVVALDLKRRLEKLGYDVLGPIASANQVEALAESTAPDLVLMDIALKGERDGIEAAGVLRRRRAVPIIYLTAYADDRTLARAKSTEPYGYLIKPFKDQDLRTTIEMALFKHATDMKLIAMAERLRATEAEARRNEERLALILEAVGAGAWDWNLQTGEIYVSPHWVESLGYSPAEVSAESWSWESLISPEDLPRLRRARTEHFEGRAPICDCVYRLRTKAGQWRYTLHSGRVVERGSQGEPLRMMGTDTDLSEDRRLGLTGIIPICACCKKVRDHAGRWNQLEGFFTKRTLVQFSHGLCPDCLKNFDFTATNNS